MLDELIEEDDGAGTLLVAGVPRGGKTEFAYHALLAGLRAFGDEGAVMCVSNRMQAGELSDRVIHSMGALGQVRPVTTLSALAFRVIAGERFAAGRREPKLLNGAEQDALLRQVLAVHLMHAERGELCDACTLLRAYFARDDWARSAATPPESPRAEGSDTAAMFASGLSSAFIGQLRDMFARMDELGVRRGRENELLRGLHDGSQAAASQKAERLETQWRLAFALRGEYAKAIEDAYPDEYRLDASHLLVEGEDTLRRSEAGRAFILPRLLVVDDFQDTTLAGLRFIEAMQSAGTRVVLVGNPDEAVQTFRGSYPDYLFTEAQRGPLQARLLKLRAERDGGDGHAAARYLDVVAARVSLSIASPEAQDVPLPHRPGKLPQLEGALPIRPIDQVDDSLNVALYRSAREELDDVVWRIKRARLDRHAAWNDMAVIAHDNATVRAFGERLRRDGVPVRYSSVTRPLNGEPFVQGLFALIELARLRRQGMDGTSKPLVSIGAFARRCVSTLMACPLITTGAKPGQGGPARLDIVESAMQALASLAGIEGVAQAESDDAPSADRTQGEAALSGCLAAWNRLVAAHARADRNRSEANTHIDDSLIDPDAAEDPSFGMLAQYAMLALDDPRAPASRMLALIAQVLGDSPQLKAFQRVWTLVDDVADGMQRLAGTEPQFALALAWQATGVKGPWKREVLRNTPEGRAANDRLDTAMRLFQYAQDGASGRDIVGFMAQVRSMHIEADSLAHVGPVEQAVTLTTPASAAGRHFKHVWLPAMQQGVWPNLSERATLFAGEELAETILHGEGAARPSGMRDSALKEVLSGEKKSLLVALTRGECTVNPSAVWNDDLTPSDFLYGYMPERCPRERSQVAFAAVGQSGGQRFCGLHADVRGLVAQARVMLARHPADSPEGRDAAATLRLLADHGVRAADPGNWSFMDTSSPTGPADAPAEPPMVTLSPSAVDNLWACPVCWLLEHRFAGPRLGAAASAYGTVIHAVAQRGSEEGLDLPGTMAGASLDERIRAVSDRLFGLYDELRPDVDAIANPRERYAAMRKDDRTREVLGHIADYFVRSNTAEYLGANAGKFDIGTLSSASCEEPFSARFDMGDILAAVNALPGMAGLSRRELCDLMGWLVGGWPEGMCEDIVVRLSGRIDRRETRVMADGSSVTRLIDYKTGRAPSSGRIVNDLQLVCYQLGLAFCESGEQLPPIAQCALFHVADKTAPAESYAPEGLFQPPLFDGPGLNAQAFTPRSHYVNASAVLDIPSLPQDKPDMLDGLDDTVWRRFVALNGTQSLWALTMIARIFYAAAASRSERLIAHPSAEHRAHCRMLDVCPACAGQLDTVFEARQA